MTTFREALQRGLNAHDSAQHAQRELDEVLALASKDVADLLQTDIRLTIELVDQPIREPSPSEAAMGLAAPRQKVRMVIAKDRRGAFETLATIELSEIGFPLTLRWGNRVDKVLDRGGFEGAIAALLASATTGEKLKRLALG